MGFEGGFCGSLGGGVAVAWDLKEGFGDNLGVRVTMFWDLKGFLWWLAAASGSRLSFTMVDCLVGYIILFGGGGSNMT